MRECFQVGVVLLMTCLLAAQTPAAKSAAKDDKKSAATDAAVKDFFKMKITAEWDALKSKDKKAYGALLADDYQGVEVDNQGERTKLQAISEMTETNVFNYTLWGYKLIPLGQDAAFAIYEVTLQFPPKSVVRFSRVYVTELWIKRDGEWKELHYQETHVK